MKAAFGILAAIAGVMSFFPYFRDIFRKRTTPHIYSWLVWSILQITAVIAMVQGHAGYGALGLGIGAGVSVIVFFLSFKYGTKNITTFDTVCLVGALAAIAVWIFAENVILSVTLITIIDFIAFLPTYRKGYAEPHSETSLTYLMSAISNLFAVAAIAQYSITTTLYTASLVITNTIFVLILLLRRSKIQIAIE